MTIRQVLLVVRKEKRKLIENIRVIVGNTNVIPARSVRNLGAILDEELSMDNEVQAVVRSANFHIRCISKFRPFLDHDTCSRIIHAIVTSRLDYHNGLLSLPGFKSSQLFCNKLNR